MRRSRLRHLRRCRLLFVLALCAWLGLVGSVFAQHRCCAAMDGMAGATTMVHHDGAPQPLHADGMHAGCTCAHMTAAALPAPAGSASPPSFAAQAWPAWPAAAAELARAPLLRPPLA